MKPDAARVLQGVSLSLLTQVLPEVATPFGQQTTSVAAGLAAMVGEEFDRAADRLVAENGAVRTILRDAMPLLAADLQASVTRALRTSAAGYRVSALQAENDALRGALVDVHAAIDTIESDAARAIDGRIWEELVESTRRREWTMRIT